MCGDLVKSNEKSGNEFSCNKTDAATATHGDGLKREGNSECGRNNKENEKKSLKRG